MSPPSLDTVDDVFNSITEQCNGDHPGFPCYFLYMDAYCSARKLDIPWKIHQDMPSPSAGDFVHLITLYDALGEKARCRSLLLCMQNLKLSLDTTAAMRLAVYLARSMPDVPTRKAVIESLVYRYVRAGPKRLYGHAAQALLLTSDRPGEVFDELIQTSLFTIGLLFKRLVELHRFEEFASRIGDLQHIRQLGFHDYSVIITRLGQARQFPLILRLISERRPSAHVLTSLIAQASKLNQKDFIRTVLSCWPDSVPMDSICITALLGARILDLPVCELKAQHEPCPDGLLYSRILYLCRTAADVSRVWNNMISRDIEPDVSVNIALSRAISNLEGLDGAHGRSLHAALIARAIVHMRSRNLKWPAILDSAIVIAGHCQAPDVQGAAYRLLRKFNMFPSSAAMCEMLRLGYRP